MNVEERHIAALDLGSNSFHLIIAKIIGSDLKIVYREKQQMRMKDVGAVQENLITSKKMEEAIKLLQHFKIIANKYSARVLAVATSSIRESENKIEFIDKVFAETGIRVNVINGDEEAELALISFKHYANKLPTRYMLFDLGGGSTEFIFVENQKIVKKFSLPIGAVRLTTKNPLVNEGDNDAILNLKQLVRSELTEASKFFSGFNCEKTYGMGGTVSAVCMLVERNVFNRRVEYNKLRDYVIEQHMLHKISLTVLSCKSIEERSKIRGLEKSRADIITAGILILEVFFAELNLNCITFAWSGLREGIILNELNKEVRKSRPEIQ